MTLMLLLALLTGASGWRDAGPDHAWSFPRDHHARHAYRNEWWYVTGHLAPVGADEPAYGFQVTFFRLGIAPEMPPWDSDWAARDLVMAHVAITDVGAGRHEFHEVLTRPGPGRGGFPALPDSVLAWCRAPAGEVGRWSLARREDGFAVSVDGRLELTLTPERPRVFQGPNGFSVKDPQAGAGSLYYSYTRLAARGVLADTLQVHGRAWLDREIFTDQLAARHEGWDWLSLQLDDGRDLMVFTLRDRDGRPDTARATLVEPGGAVRWLEAPLDVLSPRRWWTSPRTGARYPVAWALRLPAVGVAVDLEAVLDDQENVGRVTYWEGAVRGPGCRGYVERTGVR